jgi:tripartite-type tricarboxylate transporter receptor subunit TctC
MLLQKYVNPDAFVDYKLLNHIAIFNSDPCGLVVKSGAPYKNVQEFLDYAKAHPGELLAANSGPGATWHVITMQFEQFTGTSFIHVPFEGGTGAAIAVGGGHADFSMVSAAEAATIVDAGLGRFLAIGSAERDPNFPDVPTFKEQGIDFVNGVWRDLSVPVGTPPDVSSKLESALKQIYEDEDFRTVMKNGKFGLQWMSGPEFKAYLDESDDSYKVLFEKIQAK